MAHPLFSAATILLTLCVAMEAACTTTFASAADVNIYNDIGIDPPIQVHCKLGNLITVLPQQTVVAGGHVGFGFKPNVWGSTKYHCDFTWGVRTQGFNVWVDDFFLSFWRRRPCTHCEWVVGVRGFYRSEAGRGDDVFVHPWK